MNDPFHNDEEKLARLIREAGDPHVAPDPDYAESLRSTILDHLGPEETVTTVTKDAGAQNAASTLTTERNRKMKRLIRLAVAASLFVVLGGFVAWAVIDRGSTNLAFAEVAKTIDNIQCVTFDMATEVEQEDGQIVTNNSKGFFRAPSLQRIEAREPAKHDKDPAGMIMISDNQAGRCLVLVPEQKLAIIMDMEKVKESIKKSPSTISSDLFDRIRQLVREKNNDTNKNVEKLGKKEIEGKTAIGFRIHDHMVDMICWADPQTAHPIRIEVTNKMWGSARVIMNHFCYDVTLDPSLFSFELPEGYSLQTLNMEPPVEEDLLRTLRIIAENNQDKFPTKLGMNQEVLKSIVMHFKPELKKIEKEFGITLKPGEKPSPEIMVKAAKRLKPLTHKYTKGIQFYMQLTLENNPHYAGKDVKLDTPDRPILWYKPTGSDQYRVIYADLSVKDASPEEVKQFSETSD